MSDERRFVSQVVVKAARKLKAQRATKQPAWFGLGMLGTIGWSVSVPTVAGACSARGGIGTILVSAPGRCHC
jgi:predicted F0F1-ATPase subunit